MSCELAVVFRHIVFGYSQPFACFPFSRSSERFLIFRQDCLAGEKNWFSRCDALFEYCSFFHFLFFPVSVGVFFDCKLPIVFGICRYCSCQPFIAHASEEAPVIVGTCPFHQPYSREQPGPLIAPKTLARLLIPSVRTLWLHSKTSPGIIN